MVLRRELIKRILVMTYCAAVKNTGDPCVLTELSRITLGEQSKMSNMFSFAFKKKSVCLSMCMCMSVYMHTQSCVCLHVHRIR